MTSIPTYKTADVAKAKEKMAGSKTVSPYGNYKTECQRGPSPVIPAEAGIQSRCEERRCVRLRKV